MRTGAQKEQKDAAQHVTVLDQTVLLCGAVYLGGCNEDLSIFWSTQVVHDAHQLTSLSFGLLSLRHMQVHFIAIEVSIIGAADALVEPKGPAAAVIPAQHLCCRKATPAGEMYI